MFDDEDDFLDDVWDDPDTLEDGEDEVEEFAPFLAADWAIDGDFFGLWMF